MEKKSIHLELGLFFLLLYRKIIWATHIKSINQQPEPKSNNITKLKGRNLAGKIPIHSKTCQSVSYQD